jgi:tetratricopeptide (TPR) repeat protein
MSRIDTLLGFIRSNPQDPFPRYALALEYKNAARLDEARATFDQLMSANPDYTAAYLHAGNTLVALGLRDEARAVYQRGVEACVRRGDSHARGELEGALGAL